ncbi:MAG: hypothetical protein IT367_12680, partial [Candidatus Hydrogenedentes bacterium]|nr:hypothetical protein [Candidatus Hydrogenedentota bacterium]
EKKSPAIWAAVPENLPGPEMVAQPKPMAMVMEPVAVNGDQILMESDQDELFPAITPSPRPRRKPFRFRR